MDAKVVAMYAEKNNSYLGKHGGDVTITVATVAVLFGIMTGMSYDAVMKQARSNWATNQCNPIYMPFAGVIVPQPGQSALKTTVDNFDYCVHKNFSEMFSVFLLPLEFINFMVLTTLDLMIQSMVAGMGLLVTLSALIQKSTSDSNKSLADMAIPVILIVAKMRDAVAKGTASILAGVYTTYTVYNVMVSGLLNVSTIMLDLLIGLSASILAMFAVAMVLMNPITFPIGLGLYFVANASLVGVLVPTIVIYALLQAFMSATFGKSAKPAPSIPKIPKMKKNKNKKKK